MNTFYVTCIGECGVKTYEIETNERDVAICDGKMLYISDFGEDCLHSFAFNEKYELFVGVYYFDELYYGDFLNFENDTSMEECINSFKESMCDDISKYSIKIVTSNSKFIESYIEELIF